MKGNFSMNKNMNMSNDTYTRYIAEIIDLGHTLNRELRYDWTKIPKHCGASPLFHYKGLGCWTLFYYSDVSDEKINCGLCPKNLNNKKETA